MFLEKLPLKLLLSALKVYQVCLSPLKVSSCRFYPTCSAYAVEALRFHGVLKGGLLMGKRLLRCHPLCKGGHDPVPDAVFSEAKYKGAAKLHAKS